jgi:hypothetical protein
MWHKPNITKRTPQMTDHSMAKMMLKLYPDISEKDLIKYSKIKEPQEGECCGRGCNPCVWDHYYMAIRRAKEQN